MLRKATLPTYNEQSPLTSETDDMIPRTELSMKAARKILEVVYHIVQIVGLPGPEVISLALGTYRIHVAYAHIVSGLIDDPAAESGFEDLLRLQRVAECVEATAMRETVFVPLAQALKSVLEEVERQIAYDAARQTFEGTS